MIHVYTGNGKGKTTAAIGVVVRSLACGKNILFAQFMKGVPYGEVSIFNRFKTIDVIQIGWESCLRKEEITEKHREFIACNFENLKKSILNNNYNLVVLDEIITAIWFGLLREECVIEFVDKIREDMEIILTGRYASEKIIEKADLVTDMKLIKHYYEKGVPAREGIEF